MLEQVRLMETVHASEQCACGGGGGGGLLPYIDYTICAAGKGMVFKPFTLG